MTHRCRSSSSSPSLSQVSRQIQPQCTTGTSVGFPSGAVVESQKFDFHSVLVTASVDRPVIVVTVLVTRTGSHDVIVDERLVELDVVLWLVVPVEVV